MTQPRGVRVLFHTFGCKANQYDTERMRQEAQARGAITTNELGSADVCVVNTCTVTNAADALPTTKASAIVIVIIRFMFILLDFPLLSRLQNISTGLTVLVI